MISHFIHLLLSMWFLLLVSTLHTLVVATSDKPRTSFAVVRNNLLLTEYAWNLNTLRKSPIQIQFIYFYCPFRKMFVSSLYIQNQYRRDGLVVRASASRSGGRGFKPRPGHTKDFKSGTYCLLVRHSAFKNGEGKLNMRSYQWTNPLL